MRIALLPVIVLSVAGCSNEQIYNAIQDSQKIDCQKYPDTRYENCMNELSAPYEEYEKERQETKDGQQTKSRLAGQ